MRASCTRRRCARSTCATSASRPGRSVQTRLSSVRRPSAASRETDLRRRCGNGAGGAAASRRAGLIVSRSATASAVRQAALDFVRGDGALAVGRQHFEGVEHVRVADRRAARACWIARPSAIERGDDRGEQAVAIGRVHEHFQRTGMRAARCAQVRALTRAPSACAPRTTAACHAIWSGRARRKLSSGIRREQALGFVGRRCRMRRAASARDVARFGDAIGGGDRMFEAAAQRQARRGVQVGEQAVLPRVPQLRARCRRCRRRSAGTA